MWVKGKVIERKDWTDNLFSLKIEAEIEPFVAGQFIKLSEVRDEHRIARAYSVVNPPNTDYVEVLAVKVEDGQLSPNLHLLNKGDEVEVSAKAAGFMTLDELPDAKHLWLIGTGTGISPYFSMLETAEPWQRFDKIVLVYGARMADDLAYLNLVKHYQQAYPEKFRFVASVTREQSEEYLQQRIPEAMSSGALEQAAKLELSAEHSQVMLCGNPEMIKEMQVLLERRGLKKNLRRKPGQITMERYW